MVLVRWHGGWARADRLCQGLIVLLGAMCGKARQLAGKALDRDDQTDQLARALTDTRGQAGVSRLAGHGDGRGLVVVRTWGHVDDAHVGRS